MRISDWSSDVCSSDLIGVKIFALEDTLGIQPLEWNLFGQSGSLSFTAGTLLWPIVFIMTAPINEYFGRRGVRFISWLAAALIVSGFVFVFSAIHSAPAAWWTGIYRNRSVVGYRGAVLFISGGC